MASLIRPVQPGKAYHGAASLFEFRNSDGKLARANCGQAAAATLLKFHGHLDMAEDRAQQIMADLERLHPPDNIGGLFGTSRRRVIRICKAFGLKVQTIEGEDAVKKELARHNPVIVMLRVAAGTFLGYNLPGGHWMVAYGYDAEHVFLSNRGKMTWDDFRAGWSGIVPRIVGMRRRGLAALSRLPGSHFRVVSPAANAMQLYVASIGLITT
jgi:hypothetical protein